MTSNRIPVEKLYFENRFIDCLPGDSIHENYRREVLGACYSFVDPKKAKDPQLIAFSKEAASLLDLNTESCGSSLFAEVFGGSKILEGMRPYSMCYGGHQFGNWAGQLGDGRAINLGEIVNSRKETWAVQLKGSGETPYSRGADGLAVLRSSVREFLCSEAMFHLGVPTTRALSLVTTGENVMRDMFYDGNPKLEPGAVVCRVAPNFIRFGSFELFASRGDIELLESLLEFTIENYFPDIERPSNMTQAAKVNWYGTWFKEVCRRTANLLVDWMHLGFVHGVMNTDNMSISGLTIDYGPYGWLENYDPLWTPNTTDANGKRYCYGRQPDIALWNLVQLANAIITITKDEDSLREGLNYYRDIYSSGWKKRMSEKLGLYENDKDDKKLIESLMEALKSVETDWTIFFRSLANLDFRKSIFNQNTAIDCLRPAFYSTVEPNLEQLETLSNWLLSYHQRSELEELPNTKRIELMNTVNPKYVLRNYLAQLAIDDATKGDFSKIDELLNVLRHPYSEQPQFEQYAKRRPEWARNRAGCSMLSCSS